MWSRRVSRVSENTITFNFLHDVMERLGTRFVQPVTVIAPTPFEERRYGFDAIIENLPKGALVAYQFKRPQEHGTYSAYFTIERKQCKKLTTWFTRGQALYVFTPYAFTRDLIAHRSSLLTDAAFCYPNDVWLTWTAKTQKTRRVVYEAPPGSRYTRITDPRKYIDLESTSWEEVENSIFSLGMQVPLSEQERQRLEDIQRREEGFGDFGRTYFVHVGKPNRQ